MSDGDDITASRARAFLCHGLAPFGAGVIYLAVMNDWSGADVHGVAGGPTAFLLGMLLLAAGLALNSAGFLLVLRLTSPISRSTAGRYNAISAAAGLAGPFGILAFGWLTDRVPAASDFFAQYTLACLAGGLATSSLLVGWAFLGIATTTGFLRKASR